MRPDVRLSRNLEFVADRNILLGIPVRDSTDPDCRAGLFDGRIRFQPPNDVLRIAIRPEPVISSPYLAVDFHPIARSTADIDATRPCGYFEIDRSGYVQCAIERTVNAS